MIRLRPDHHDQIVAHAVDAVPEEACGLLAGPLGSGDVEVVYPCRNLDASSTVYTLDPHDHLEADRDAQRQGFEIIGVYHSHTHTEAYPSPTDVGRAPDPSWHYVLVSLQGDEPVIRSFSIVDGKVTEEPVAVEGR
jgi:proteasome lid subunit RPN8/RPN11